MKGISAYASVGCSWFLLGSLVDVSVVHFVALLCCILLILGDPLLPYVTSTGLGVSSGKRTKSFISRSQQRTPTCHISLCGDRWWDGLFSTTDIDAVLCNGVEECSSFPNSINIKKLRVVNFCPVCTNCRSPLVAMLLCL